MSSSRGPTPFPKTFPAPQRGPTPLPPPTRPPSRGPNPFALVAILTLASSTFFILSSRRQSDPTSRLPKEKAHSSKDGGMIFPNLHEGEGDRKLEAEMGEMERRRLDAVEAKRRSSVPNVQVGGLEGNAQNPALGPGGGREISKGEKVWLGPAEGNVDFRQTKREEEARERRYV